MEYRYFKPMKAYFADTFDPDYVYVTNDDVTAGTFIDTFNNGGHLYPLPEQASIRIQECWVELEDDELFLLKV